MKKNYLRQGLKDKKFVNSSFYPFLRDKHIDWAIIIGGFTLQLPYIAASSRLYFYIQFLLFIVATGIAVGYLIIWKALSQFEIVYDKFQTNAKDLSKSAAKNMNFDLTNETLEGLKRELNYLPAKYKKKKSGYKDFMEYIKYDKEDFNQIVKILNKGGKQFGDTLVMVVFFTVELLVLREIPTYKKRAYHFLVAFIFITILFFIIETLDQLSNVN